MGVKVRMCQNASEWACGRGENFFFWFILFLCTCRDDSMRACRGGYSQWFTQAPFAYKGRWRNFDVLGALSSELNFNAFFPLFGALFCYAVSSCVYDHNHPYLVSERLFLAENKAFPYLRRALAHPRRALAILWDAAATWPVVIFVVVAMKQRSPKMSAACVQGLVDRSPYRSPPVTLNGHCGVIFQSIFKPNISLERSCPDLNEHVLFLWIRRATAERRPFEVCRRIDFAISRRRRPLYNSHAAIESTRQTHCFGGINLHKEWNEVQHSFYFSTW